MMFTEVALVDGEGRPVADGEVGEMLFRGPHLSLGYWNRPDATAGAFTADGFFRSGDLARRDQDGFFYIAGRAKDMIISGGVNVYPAEIEAVLLEHPEVRDAAVVGIEHPTWGEAGIAFVVPLADGGAAAESLLEYLGGRLARYKLPKEIVFLGELPRTAYGKVVKGELRDLYLGRPAMSSRPLLAHLVEGDGLPLVLLNGGMMTYASWEPIAAVLREQWQVLRCDFRGQLLSPSFGPTTAPAASPSMPPT